MDAIRDACAADKVLVGRSSKCCHARCDIAASVRLSFFANFFFKCAVERRGMSVVFTRVVCRTFASRGKSFTPESRIDILEARNWVLERREETQDDRGLDIIVCC